VDTRLAQHVQADEVRTDRLDADDSDLVVGDLCHRDRLAGYGAQPGRVSVGRIAVRFQIRAHSRA
jgi:hypothetical protein